jgi:predicted NBD/HSP70 family sugar kinase
MVALGIDVGGSSVKVAGISDRQTLWTRQSGLYSRPTRDQLVEAIRQALNGHTQDFDAVGICMPGILDRERRMITLSVNIPSLQGIVLDDLVNDALGREVPVIEIHNDSTASAYDLYATHNLVGRLLSITLGTGVGASVLDSGVPVRLSGESPGHIGMVDVSLENDPPLGPDGGAGSLEAYIGSPALVKRYGTDMAATLKHLTAEDPPLRALARAIRIFHAIYRPQYVYLIGGLGIRMGHLLPALRSLIDANLTSVARPDYRLAVGDDDFHAAKGAAKFAAKNAPVG